MYQVTTATRVLKNKTLLESKSLFDFSTREAELKPPNCEDFWEEKERPSFKLASKVPNSIKFSGL